MPRFAVSHQGGRLTITFDDGGMNLLSREALEELREIITALQRPSAEGADESKVLLFRSGRTELFAAGADMKQMCGFTAIEAWDFARLGQDLLERIERLPQLTIALIDGDCFGGALDLALSFDLRVATPRARFAHPGARIGIVTGFGGTSRWRKVIARPAANQLFLANRVIEAEEAARIGLIDQVTDRPGEVAAALQTSFGSNAAIVKGLSSLSTRSREDLVLMARALGGIYSA
jgi:enoyl-CoA hydratase